MADNGSTDGAPEEALERYPEHASCCAPAAISGYGSAVNRAVAEAGDRDDEFVDRRQPRRGVGPGQHRRAAGGRRALAAGSRARTADPRPRRLGLPVGAPPAQPDPGRDARGRRDRVEAQPVDRGLPPGAPGAQRAAGRLAVGLVPAGARARRSTRSAASTSATSCTWRTSTSATGWARRAGTTSTCPSAEILHDKGHATGRDPARNLRGPPPSTYIYLADRHLGWWRAPLRWTMKGALRVRSRAAVRKSRRESGERVKADELM